MENVVNFHSLFNSTYLNKRVLITGHTGFKGTWLKFWLEKMGAKVQGIALAPYTTPSHYKLLSFHDDSFIDINNSSLLTEAIVKFNPEIIFHLAAQPLVRYSYSNPIETWQTNIIGTANVLEAAKNLSNCKALVNITTDKCYKNNEWDWSYREIDELGGYDPYSSSKACSELITASFRDSFFHLKDFGSKHHTLIATARAGNVIGGGDWSTDRLIPDIVKATANNQEVEIRSPKAVRPWQHVLEPLTAYLLLGQKLMNGEVSFASAWNIGPETNANLNVETIIQIAKTCWTEINYKDTSQKDNHLHEAGLLMLDCSKAKNHLGWNSVWTPEQAIRKTIEWYKNYYKKGIVNTENDLNAYIQDAINFKASWT